MEIKKLEEQKREAQKEMDALLETVKTEERAFTEEEDARFTELENKIETILRTVQAIEKGRELTQVSDGESDSETEDRATENVEELEIRVFADYVRNNVISERADQNLTVGDNGDIIPVTIADKIIKKIYDISPVLEKATKYTTKGKLSIPQYGGDSTTDIKMDYATEFTDLETKSGKFKTIDLNNFLAGSLAKLSNSLINNTDIDLVNKVIEIIAEAAARFLEGEAIRTVAATDAAKGCSSVSLSVTASSSSVIIADELIDLKNKIKQAYRKDSMFIMSSDTKTAIEKLKDSTGQYLFNSNMTTEFDGKLLGYPVYVSDNMNNIATGKAAILFGDFSGLAFKETKSLEIQVLREKYATQHATGIVAWTEFDVDVENLQKIAKLVMA